MTEDDPIENGRRGSGADIPKPKAGYDVIAAAVHLAAEPSAGSNVNGCATYERSPDEKNEAAEVVGGARTDAGGKMKRRNPIGARTRRTPDGQVYDVYEEAIEIGKFWRNRSRPFTVETETAVDDQENVGRDGEDKDPVVTTVQNSYSVGDRTETAALRSEDSCGASNGDANLERHLGPPPDQVGRGQGRQGNRPG